MVYEFMSVAYFSMDKFVLPLSSSLSFEKTFFHFPLLIFCGEQEMQGKRLIGMSEHLCFYDTLCAHALLLHNVSSLTAVLNKCSPSCNGMTTCENVKSAQLCAECASKC